MIVPKPKTMVPMVSGGARWSKGDLMAPGPQTMVLMVPRGHLIVPGPPDGPKPNTTAPMVGDNALMAHTLENQSLVSQQFHEVVCHKSPNMFSVALPEAWIDGVVKKSIRLPDIYKTN